MKSVLSTPAPPLGAWTPLLHRAAVVCAVAACLASLSSLLLQPRSPTLASIAQGWAVPPPMHPRVPPNASRVLMASVATMSRAEYEREKGEWRAMAGEILAMREQPQLMAGSEQRGIVLTCSASLFALCFTNVQILLDVLQTKLPIELWRQRGELTGKQEAMLLEEASRHPSQLRMRFTEELDGAFGRLFGRFRPLRTGPLSRSKPYHLKVMALVGSAFREVMLLDSDCMAAYDPEFLWRTPQFRETGALFWPDAMSAGRSWPVWDLIGLEPREQRTVESGMVLVNKTRCWRALLACAYMNHRQDFFYRFLYGDKDTFLFAWMGLGAPFHLIEFPPLAVGRAPGEGFRGLSYAHSDPSGRLSFVHLLHGGRNNILSSTPGWNTIQFFNPEKSAFYILDKGKQVFPHSSDEKYVPFREILGNIEDIAIRLHRNQFKETHAYAEDTLTSL
eukprot:m51a1_g7065 hypothetical protein (448) ;mRNA; f:185369-187459